MAMLTKIKLLLLPSFFLLMAADCGGCGSGEYGQPAGFVKSRSIGTNDIFSITPLKKVYKVGDKVRIKRVVNVIAESQDEKGKKVNLYDLGVRRFGLAPPIHRGSRKIYKCY